VETAASKLKPKTVIAGLAVFCTLLWLLAAVHPLDRQAWVLENILLVLFAITLVFAGSRLRLSNASSICIALFVIVHIIGAHYTYARMPLGLWAEDQFGFSRNHFDRVAHFSFGFFLALPVHELLLRLSGLRRASSFWMTAALILALSGIFEIIESIVAEIVAPGVGVAWLGGQGDEWDAQNDMLCSFVGSLAMAMLVAVAEWKGKTE